MNNRISLESKIITIILLIVIFLIIIVAYLGESKSALINKCIVDGRKSEATAYFDYAFQYLNTNKLAESIANFEKAIRLDPEFTGAYTNLAIAYAKSGENDKAINTLKNVLKKDANSEYLIYLNMAQIYKRFDKEKAEIAYKKAIELHPFPKYAYFNLGEFYWSVRKFDLSIDAIKKGIEFHNLKSYFIGSVNEGIKTYPNDTELVKELSEILTDQDTANELLKQFDNVIFDFYYMQNNQKMAEKTDQIGYYYLRKREFENASEYFNQSIQFWDSKRNKAYKHLENATKGLQSE